MRKGYTKLTKDDFETYPIWELQHSLTTAEPYTGKVPFKGDSTRAFFVSTSFTLADHTKMHGWTMVCVPPYELHGLNPTILTAGGPVDLTKLARQPKKKDVEKALQLLSKTLEQVFPLQFETGVPVPDGPAKGEMKGFLHRLSYEEITAGSGTSTFSINRLTNLIAPLPTLRGKKARGKSPLSPRNRKRL